MNAEDEDYYNFYLLECKDWADLHIESEYWSYLLISRYYLFADRLNS